MPPPPGSTAWSRRCPPSDGQFQYRVRNDEERYERVVAQDRLEPVSAPASSKQDTLIKRTFDRG